MIERLRLQYKKDLLKIVDIVLSHQVWPVKSFTLVLLLFLVILLRKLLNIQIFLIFKGIKSKNKLILSLMEQLVYPNPAAYRDQLIRFSSLNHINYSEVCNYIFLFDQKFAITFIMSCTYVLLN